MGICLHLPVDHSQFEHQSNVVYSCKRWARPWGKDTVIFTSLSGGSTVDLPYWLLATFVDNQLHPYVPCCYVWIIFSLSGVLSQVHRPWEQLQPDSDESWVWDDRAASDGGDHPQASASSSQVSTGTSHAELYQWVPSTRLPGMAVDQALLHHNTYRAKNTDRHLLCPLKTNRIKFLLCLYGN